MRNFLAIPYLTVVVAALLVTVFNSGSDPETSSNIENIKPEKIKPVEPVSELIRPSNIKPDERVVFFNTAARESVDGRHWILPIHGWVFEPEDSTIRKAVIAKGLKEKYGLIATDSTSANFARRANLFLADNERDKQVVVRVGNQQYQLPVSKPNGHFDAEINMPVDAAKQLVKDGAVAFLAVLPSDDERVFSGRILVTSAEGISVISDIDDTVKVTDVTDTKKLFDRTFFRDFEAVDGMAALYTRWSKQGVHFHYVSSSPWQLYGPLADFFFEQSFPPATLSLKSFRFKDKSFLNLFKKGTETKPLQIEPILKSYPRRHFIFVGDSGEQDPEVYADLMRRYPEQILRIYIRKVGNASSTDTRFKEVFDGIGREKWILFSDPDQLELPVAPDSH